MTRRIGLVRMPIGNLQSAWNALYELGFDPVYLDAASDYDSISHLIVPGDGNFRAVMQHIDVVQLGSCIRGFAASGRPTLGICVGMQILATRGTESAETSGLGLIEGVVQRMEPAGRVRLPHIGWNSVSVVRDHPVFAGLKRERDFYFVHSFAFAPTHGADCLATTDYGGTFASVVGRSNVLGFQFHPEKSQINGLKLIENFCNWDGKC